MKRSAALVALSGAAWVAFSGWALVTDSRVGETVALLSGMALLGSAFMLWRATERERARWQGALDAMQAGIVVFGEDDRLLMANAEFRRLYELEPDVVAQGITFESIVRSSVAAGFVPEAAGREEAWIAERLAQHRSAEDTTHLRRMRDGHWRRIGDRRLADGRRIGFSIDVTDLVQQQQALDAARAEAERAHRLLHDAVEALPAAIEVWDDSDRLVLFNRRLVQDFPHLEGRPLLGERFETLVRAALDQGLVADAQGREEAWLAERLATRGRSAGPQLQRTPSGMWQHAYETPMPGGGLVTVRLDASAIVQQRDELRAAHARAAHEHALLGDAVESLPEGFALYDREDRLLVCNQRYRDIYNASAPAILVGATFESILRYGLERAQYPQAEADPQAWLAARLRQHREPSGTPMLQELPGNRWLRIDERRTSSGGVAGMRTDVTELVHARQALESSRLAAEQAATALRAANEQLEVLSATDALTGLANRRRFDTRLDEEVLRAQRHGTALALLLADIDHFKLYNDLLGHPQGDRALQAVAAVLRRQARRPGELVARYGGEEFALLLPHADAATAQSVAERCARDMATLALPHAASPTAAHVTLSIGVAQWLVHSGDSAAALLRRADAALYAAKAAGRARCVTATDFGQRAGPP